MYLQCYKKICSGIFPNIHICSLEVCKDHGNKVLKIKHEGRFPETV